MRNRLSTVTGGGAVRLLAVAGLLAISATAVVLSFVRGGGGQPTASADSANAPLSQTNLSRAYIRFEGENSGLIPGGSLDNGFQGWSNLISYSESLTSPTDVATGLPTGAIRTHDFTVTKPVDKASVLLLNIFANGETLDEVKIELRRTGGGGVQETYLRYTLLNARLTGRRIAGSLSGGSTEILTINFQQMEVEWPADGLIGSFERQTIS